MRTRLLIVGLDCAEPSLVFHRWIGDLPNLQSLVRSGICGPLRTIDPPISVPAWSCMMAGVDAGELGIYGFRNRTDYSYAGLATADSRWLVVDRVWDILGRGGKHVVVLGVPQTYPPSPVNGEMVSCFLTPDTTKDPYTYPADLRHEIESVICGPYKVDVEGFRSDDRDRILAEIYAMTEQHFAIARHLMKTTAWDFLMLHEIGLDRIQHAFWRYMDPEHRDFQQGHRYANAIHDYYVYLDKCIGEMLALIDDATTVMVVSDHGAQRMEGAIAINEWLIANAYMTLQQPLTAPLPLVSAPVDWSRTVAWGEGGYYSRLCLNVRGREPQGVVSPDEYDALRDELASRLAALPGPSGRLLGTRVYRPEQLWKVSRGIPPDLLVYFGNLAWRSNGTVGGGSLYTFDNDTGPDDANHSIHGVFVLSGPSVRADQRDEVSIFDIAPTILGVFDYVVPDSMRGRNLLATPAGAY